MKPVLVTVSGWVTVVAGLVIGIALFTAGPQSGAVAAEPVAIDCEALLADDVLGRLEWGTPAATHPATDNRCRWQGRPGTVTVAVTEPARPLAALGDRCDRFQEAFERFEFDRFERSAKWLKNSEIQGGCVGRGDRGRGAYVALGQVRDTLVLVRFDLDDKRSEKAVKKALSALVVAGANAPPIR